jgi:RecA-family ATPase
VRPFDPIGRFGDAYLDDEDRAYLAGLEAERKAHAAPKTNGHAPAADDGYDRAAMDARGEPASETAQSPTFRRIINPAAWEGAAIPEREWIVPDYIPHKAATLLSGDGGQGKSLLALQLAVARALARDWVGLLPTPGRTLVLSAEDDGDELHRRLDDIRRFYGASWKDLEDISLVDLVGEDCILGQLMKGEIVAAPMYHALDAYVTEFKPNLVILDVLADMFAGDESKRAQVRQFVNLLKTLCRKHNCAILILAHPSLAGMASGSGLSGSTDWNNAVRARLYLQTPKAQDGTEQNKKRRTLEGLKANYGERGGKFDLEWKKGLFVPLATESQSPIDTAATDKLFIDLLEQFTREGRAVSSKKGPTYAPAEFAAHADAKGVTKITLKAAMDRLLKDKRIEILTFGPPSHQRSKLISRKQGPE